MMKALSIQQPWAWLIVNGHKDVENRTWYTYFSGRFLIHTGKRFDHRGYEYLKQRPWMTAPLPSKKKLERGGIVGVATLLHCNDSIKSIWFEGPYGFVLTDAKPLPFYPCRGQLGFFDVELPDNYKGVNHEEKRT